MKDVVIYKDCQIHPNLSMHMQRRKYMMKLSIIKRMLAAALICVMLAAALPMAALAESYTAVVIEKTVSVFNDPGLTDYTGSLKKGAVVVVNEVNGETAMISYNGVSGYYVKLSALEDVLEIGRPAFVNKKTKAYAKPDTGSKKITVEKGYEVTLLAVEGKWALVAANGYGVYMLKSTLTLIEENAPAPENTPSPDLSGSIPCTVTASTLTIYKAADDTSDVLGNLSAGDEVSVIAYNKNWAYLYFDGIYGYSRTSGLIKTDMLPTPEPSPSPEAEPIPAVVVAESVKAYAKPDGSSKVLATLEKGTKVNVLEYDSTWAKIEKNGYIGYCKTSALSREVDIPETTPTPAPENNDPIPAIVSASSVKVYAKANTSSAVIATLKYGAEVNVLEYDSTWAKIEKNGHTGYCKVKALKAKSSVQPTPSPEDKYREKYPDIQFTATAVYDLAPVYYYEVSDTPDQKLSIGTQVDVYAYNDKWAYIGIGEGRGFVRIKYLNSGDYTELASGDSGSNVQKLQETLEEMGFFDGVPTGNYSTLTASAVRRFQKANSLTETGNADLATLRVLYGGYAAKSSLLKTEISSGSTGEKVNRVQTRLYYLDYFTKAASIDGDYGTTTIIAVKLFQEAAQLNVTGNIDSATMKVLYSADAPKLPSGKTAADYTPTSSTNPEVLKIPSGLGSTQVSLPANASNAEKIEYVIYLAQCQLGKPYIYATAGPNSYDCSGLTVYCYRKVGKTLGRSAYAQGYNSSSGTKIENVSDLKRGDIVCFNTINDSDLVDHVGVYIGNGYFIHASSGDSNGHQVCVSNLNTGYYSRVFSWGRRPIE